MKKMALALILVILYGVAKAEIITSCDGSYVARIEEHHRLVVLRDGRRVGAVKIDHSIDGGVFSLDDSVLVIFGLPFVMDRRFPQVSHLSIYLIGKDVRAVGRRVYGGGVYNAEFSGDRKFIVINSRFGVDVMDIEKERVHSFDVAYVPGFEMQKCEKK